MSRQPSSSEFLQYLASFGESSADGVDADQLPSLNDLSKEMKISVALLREQLEAAKALGLVEVRPRTGIRRLPYSFLPAVRQSLFYAVKLDSSLFDAYADLRNQIEAAYWGQAVRQLTPQDYVTLHGLIVRAWQKLNGSPIQIPHEEHRQLHLCLFSRLENPFVQGLLEAYWDVYEAVGLNLYADYNYLRQVWQYHETMVAAITSGDIDVGYRALVEHKDLLHHRTNQAVQ